MTCPRSSSFQGLLAGLLLLVATTAMAAPVPVALERLVPADPLLVVYAPSLEEIERDVVALLQRMGVQGADEDMSIFSVFETIAGDLGDLELVMDPTKPFAAVLRLAPGTPAPLFSMMVPLRDGLTAEDVERRLGVAPLATDEGYVVLGTDTSYRMGGVRQPMFAGIGSDDLTVRLDVEGVFTALGPMVDMVLQMALQQPGADDRPPMMNPEGVEAALDLVDVLRDGIGTLELSADIDGERIELAGGLRFRDDGPLALGAQPRLDAVWDDAALLDPDASILIASGVDLQNLSPLMDAILGIVRSMDTDTYAVQRVMNLLQQQSIEMWLHGLRPYVSSIDFRGERMAYRWIEDDMAPLETQANVQEMLSAFDGLGLRTTWDEPRDVAGYRVVTGDLEFDVEEFMRLDPQAPELAAEEIAAMKGMVDVFLGPFTLAAGDRQTVFVMDPEPGAVQAFLERVADDARGDAPARLAEARAWAGDEARSVMVLEVADYFSMIHQMLSAAAAADDDAATVLEAFAQLPSTPVFGMATVDGEWLRGRLSLETEVLVGTLEAMGIAD